MQPLRVNEIFTSIQGEGPWAGRLCVFIRLQGCNLECDFCDTKYARSKDVPSQVFTNADSLIKMLPYRPESIVWTGGEPCLQLDTILELQHYISLYHPWYEFAIESNGTIPFDVSRFDLACISPKTLDLNLDWISNHNTILKYVVDDSNIDSTISACDDLDIPIYLMPKGCTERDVKMNSHLIYNKLMSYRGNTCFVLTPRLHILLGVK